MPAQSTAEEHVCPAAPLLVLLRGRWTVFLIHYLGNRGTLRFGERQRALIGISPKVLTERLRAFERYGLVWLRGEREGRRPARDACLAGGTGRTPAGRGGSLSDRSIRPAPRLPGEADP